MGRIFYFSIVISPTFGKLNKRSVINRIYEKNYNNVYFFNNWNS